MKVLNINSQPISNLNELNEYEISQVNGRFCVLGFLTGMIAGGRSHVAEKNRIERTHKSSRWYYSRRCRWSWRFCRRPRIYCAVDLGNRCRDCWQPLIVEVMNRDIRTTKMNIGFTVFNTFIFGVENLLVFWLGVTAILASQGPGNGTPVFSVGGLHQLQEAAHRAHQRAHQPRH